jgi:WhiB family transcriptional regulator, redox-sensing transcriptional regulator
MSRISKRDLPKILPIMKNWEWQYEGACRNTDPDVFFLQLGDRAGTKRKKEQKAISICKTCPVINKCLTHALAVPEAYGIWGGTTEEQRSVMLNKRLH